MAINNPNYIKYVQALEFFFCEKPTVVEPTVVEPTVVGGVPLVITTLAGESIIIVYDPNQTIFDLKSLVEKKFKIPLKKQCLLYNNVELKISDKNDKDLKLRDYDVKPNSEIYLVILLYAIPEKLDKVIFDLFWGYPHRNWFFELLNLDWFRTQDYLDASVFLYSDSEFKEVVNYCNKTSKCSSAVTHSGDDMDDKKKLGHHTIAVSIKSIPPEVNRLVFTLSARNSPDVSKYLKPCLEFYNAGDPGNKLCDDTMEDAVKSEAIIMCCLTNRGDKWRVVSLKEQSPGNAKDYGPLKNTIRQLIESGKML
ncbi:uncharacterized protein LOC114520184 [Dendronephthya gigantea]|uniref:uncharacterized protein LOC114520184 n=1 Tax=Dendronephthya gigantea TaxID=151771 RepID=UPI00106B0E84|nr:uncharacterized protein LOC114520184 [Dendronephthya gigantea]